MHYMRSSPLTLAALLVLALIVLLIPDLAADPPYLLGDDYLFLAELEGHDVIPGHPGDLTHFGNRGAHDVWNLPWWADDFRIRQFRQLTSLLMEVEHAALGVSPLGFKLVNTLLVAVIIVLVALFHQRTLSRNVAVVATALYACAFPGLALIANWHAAIHHPLATIAMLCGILVYVRHHRHRTGLAVGAALVWLVMGLLLSEAGLVLTLYITMYELVVVQPGRAMRARRRLGVLALFVGIGIAYVAWHQVTGYGGRATPVYIDPLSPRGLLEVPPRFLFAASLGIPLVTLPALLVALLGIFLGRHTLSTESRRTALFASICWIASALYFSLTAPDQRVIVIPAIGYTTLIAIGVVALWQWAGQRRAPAHPAAVLTRLIAAACVVAVMAIAGVKTVTDGRAMATKQALERRLFDDLVEIGREGRVLVLMQPTVPIFHTHWLPILRARALVDHGVDLRAIHLAPPGVQHVYRRVDAHTLALQFEPWIRWWFPPYRQQCSQFRAEHPLMAVTATCARDLLASALFRFHVPLEDDQLVFILITRDGLYRLTPPAPGLVWEIPQVRATDMQRVEPPPWIGRARKD